MQIDQSNKFANIYDLMIFINTKKIFLSLNEKNFNILYLAYI